MKRVLVSITAVLFIFLGVVSTSSPIVGFPQVFERFSGTPVAKTVNFTSTGGEAVIKLTNGNATDTTFEKVSSSTITLNGSTVFGPANFNQKVSYLESSVSLNPGSNTLTVLLKGKPGGQISIQIEQEEITKSGYAAANVGDLAEVTLTGNEFYYNFIDGKFQGVSNTIQLEEYTEYPDLDGFFLKAEYLDGTNGNSVWTIVPIFMKFSNNIIGAYIDSDPNLKIEKDGYTEYHTTTLISKLGTQPGPPNIIAEDNYNAITCLFGRTFISLSGLSIGAGGLSVSVTPSLKETEGVLPDVFSLTQGSIGPNILKAEYENTVLNIIHEGTSMIIDSPGGGSYANGFGAAIKAADVDFLAIGNEKKFYFLNLEKGFAYGFLYPNSEEKSIGYWIRYINPECSDCNPDPITGTFVYGQQICGGVSLPNSGLGWGCDMIKGLAFIIDPAQGILAAYKPAPDQYNKTPEFWIGGW